ncbi:TPA: YolD-like family protein, partial [Staphylococcus aureus]|nr:YolD-like family protein [Staphylococcus aureus]HAY0813350.1 YolD-like family protein [Staphylococcus aureus]HAZ5073312.1 YolD-like family protein [Staphylococcus aureus]HAZ5185937.1 YolD-like family protein [Staphylococcus aureus]HCU8982310.1 YolD-like family protein [Staphylococcus aureus]
MIPNPNAPDEYKYETDYRKIPRKYLNPKIPQGRGKIKWQAFATLPQQFEILEQIIKDQNKIEKPLLTHDSLDNLDQIFQIKIQNDELCTISYWEDGSISNYTGKILKIDTINGYFTFYDSTNTKHTFFNTNVYN